MFYGTDNHTVDPKGRMFVPVRYRKYLTGTFYALHEGEKCIRLYTPEGFETFREKLRGLPRAAEKLRRAILQDVFECELDASGRVLIPELLRNYAEIKKDVKVIGNDDRIEIWDAEAYKEYMSDMTPETVAAELDKYFS